MAITKNTPVEPPKTAPPVKAPPHPHNSTLGARYF